jgi:high affinity Mn2+ porin
MLIMKWQTDNEGRLMAAWEETREFPRSAPDTGIAPKVLNPISETKRVRWICNLPARSRKRICFMLVLEYRRRFRNTWTGAAVLILLASRPFYAQDAPQSTASSHSQRWDFHFQSTLIGQGVLPFAAEYSGPNSLEPHGEVKDTLSFDITARVHLWRGGEFFADVLSWQGYGLSKTTGMAGFPNGEAYRVGKTYPDAFVSRAYLRETVPLGGGQDPGGDRNAAPGNDRRLTFMVGHFSASDVFDKNAYANDARTQFMNWALVNNAAWDYPANSLGYTNGASAKLNVSSWAARAGIFQVSRVANGIRMDWDLVHAWSWTGEVEKRHSFRGYPGALRLLAYEERTHMGSYQESLSDPQSISANGLLGYRSKYGFGANLDQEIGKDLGVFARLGWSDGKEQIWEFTDVDRTASAGVSLKGETWRRSGDTLGIAGVVNGITSVHRQFLANGGLGVTVGDGKLDYGKEEILEAYYSIGTRWNVSVSPDFQFVVNPAYNRVRGPASIFALRLHWEK